MHQCEQPYSATGDTIIPLYLRSFSLGNDGERGGGGVGAIQSEANSILFVLVIIRLHVHYYQKRKNKQNP